MNQNLGAVVSHHGSKQKILKDCTKPLQLLKNGSHFREVPTYLLDQGETKALPFGFHISCMPVNQAFLQQS